MADQNYQNHVQRVPVFVGTGFALMTTVIGAAVNLYQSIGDHERLYNASLILVLSVCALLVAYFSRAFALKAQDRGVRAEENLRHFALTGKLLDSRLTLSQIIALRFASDGEFAPLAQRAVEKNMAADEIKRAVQSWRADTHRV
jgi:hypothetical protein